MRDICLFATIFRTHIETYVNTTLKLFNLKWARVEPTISPCMGLVREFLGFFKNSTKFLILSITRNNSRTSNVSECLSMLNWDREQQDCLKQFTFHWTAYDFLQVYWVLSNSISKLERLVQSFKIEKIVLEWADLVVIIRFCFGNGRFEYHIRVFDSFIVLCTEIIHRHRWRRSVKA